MGFQPVPRDRCARPCETGNDVVVSQEGFARRQQNTGWKPMLPCSFASPTVPLETELVSLADVFRFEARGLCDRSGLKRSIKLVCVIIDWGLAI